MEKNERMGEELRFVKSGTNLTGHILPGAESFHKNALIIFLSIHKEICKQ